EVRPDQVERPSLVGCPESLRVAKLAGESITICDEIEYRAGTRLATSLAALLHLLQEALDGVGLQLCQTLGAHRPTDRRLLALDVLRRRRGLREVRRREFEGVITEPIGPVLRQQICEHQQRRTVLAQRARSKVGREATLELVGRSDFLLDLAPGS